ncbi:RnfABCDGE type electron transport complex subunit B [Oxalobacter sp. OttesenSCG-928-P03]|nr:RnfABCDGE type electron transport complex subunit B [Oxalobacter sp. OttesenSCG-928-P03]
MNKATSEEILALLPQTQCKKCGYECCRDYAKAIEEGAPINRCPTGGVKGIRRLSRLTGKPYIPLDSQYGEERPRHIAVIDESSCIGCRLCIKACPVDAIIGTNGFTHTVLPLKCTGCDLCPPVCPVDCIIMKNVSGTKTGWDAWSPMLAKRARVNYELREKRLEREIREENLRLTALTRAGKAGHKKKDTVKAAIEKARARSAQKN